MKRIVALLTGLALMIPGAAVASANSETGSYKPHGVPSSGVHNVTASRGPGQSSSGTPAGSVSPAGANKTVATTSTGSLPFTGLDLAALATGGAVLLAAGMVLRRFSATDRR